MTAILRKNLDTAGGLIIEGSPDVFVNGYSAVRIGDAVAAHGSGIHGNAVMIQGSSSVFINGIAVSRVGDLASCGHVGVATGDTNTTAG